ncbi:hypothetical protein BS47DRAFT_1490670 [Hydnum rufescens UP504]|uniref:HNH nuclease domain-containing protein n=1 Tax=Hydnum rufescens UP504 TaxID=1448309 RepID=A0A9P6DLL0_9AGAM|nr:hypothetical protein BS47DRAFT_1490670 [Hydnum rufescens UP504]
MVWTIMDAFGIIPATFQRDPYGPKIHALTNALTLDSSVHEAFDSLRIYLDPISEVPNGYRLGAFPERILTLLGLPSRVVFKSSDPLLPLPNPRYLELHAAAAKVAHLSGTADYIEKTLRDLETVRVLSENGSSAELLKSVLQISAY